MVSIDVLERSSSEITLVLKDVPLEYANAVRRAVLEEVPTMAVDYVVFYDNTSALSDEIISHRISMIPLKSDTAIERYKQPEECKSSSPPDGCYTSLYLEAETGHQEELVVYSRDLKPQEDPEVIPVYRDIPILKLGPQQRVVLEAWARLGRGREHIKWSPAAVSVLTHVPMITIHADRCVMCRLCAENCPTKAIDVKDSKIQIDESKCTLCRQCVKVCRTEAVELDWRKDEYKLHVESSGVLKPERIVLEAMTQVKKKLQIFYEEFEKALSATGVKL
ncbi:MAG: DNA-directed RNA polymerase subunit D [Sulfolobales archaeon]|nr:DNA-directed RNA polymerase subunit D [Sulfolobales archaeon]MCX8208830.1 DNA-directed RNA polymerase subunit D [Sulfolobales archaeon]MDW8010145.1 DNA-directed RNA polymerase subunit D [Sulfolobales archaeon]